MRAGVDLPTRENTYFRDKPVLYISDLIFYEFNYNYVHCYGIFMDIINNLYN